MGNYIKVAVRNSILTLYKRGWSQRRIARELGINWKIVGRYIARELRSDSKEAISTTGNGPPPSSKGAISTPGKCGRKSTSAGWYIPTSWPGMGRGSTGSGTFSGTSGRWRPSSSASSAISTGRSWGNATPPPGSSARSG